MTASPKSWIFSSKFYHKSFIIFTFAIWIFKISEPSLCIVHGKVTHHFFPPHWNPKGRGTFYWNAHSFLLIPEASPLLKSTCASQWSSALGLSSELDSFSILGPCHIILIMVLLESTFQHLVVWSLQLGSFAKSSWVFVEFYTHLGSLLSASQLPQWKN